MEPERLREMIREIIRKEIAEWERKRFETRWKEAKAGFLLHLTLYVVFNVSCSIYVLATNQPYFWPIWPIIFWGAGLLTHLAGILIMRKHALRLLKSYPGA